MHDFALWWNKERGESIVVSCIYAQYAFAHLTGLSSSQRAREEIFLICALLYWEEETVLTGVDEGFASFAVESNGIKNQTSGRGILP